jgi:hypothetical protein
VPPIPLRALPSGSTLNVNLLNYQICTGKNEKKLDVFIVILSTHLIFLRFYYFDVKI